MAGLAVASSGSCSYVRGRGEAEAMRVRWRTAWVWTVSRVLLPTRRPVRRPAARGGPLGRRRRCRTCLLAGPRSLPVASCTCFFDCGTGRLRFGLQFRASSRVETQEVGMCAGGRGADWRRRSAPSLALACPSQGSQGETRRCPQHPSLAPPSARAPSAQPHFPAPRPFSAAWGFASSSSCRFARR